MPESNVSSAVATVACPCATDSRPGWHRDFLNMLPTIQKQADFAFRHLNANRAEEAIQEVVCNCFQAYARLVEQNRSHVGNPTSLARYAIAQVRSGRLVGQSMNVHDVTSRHCQRQTGVRAQSLCRWNDREHQWQEMLVEDGHATPADLAASRIDFPAWLKTLDPRDQQIALKLSNGESTQKVAKLFRISAGRVSQLRRELRDAWRAFHGELDCEAAFATV
ncbi:hypothetical protein [Thalassoroseus pseudoceratinae]|uniref:hypothetical protein n=1 Tax=Thalassoroseus pseudoceratinae TaxID=2713176 RepID=UPI001420E68F|nr:hypothetical protein [Thalassoroseus pseudoceratinae]